MRVRVHGPHPEIDQPTYRLSVQTDFLCDVDVTTQSFVNRISLFNRFSPTFAICTYPSDVDQLIGKFALTDELDLKATRVWLASTAYLNDSNKDWVPRFFAGLTIMQPIEAQNGSENMGRMLGGISDRSTPTGHKLQTNLDEILNIQTTVIEPEGQKPNRWIGTGEFEEIIDKWGHSNNGFGFADKTGLIFEIPFGAETAILTLKTDQSHPRLGNGLFALLKIPLLSDEKDAAEFSLGLNYLESLIWQKLGMPLIGNWCANKVFEAQGAEHNFGPSFSCFIPNLFYQPGIAENLLLYAMCRARCVRQTWPSNETKSTVAEILSKRLNVGTLK